MSIVIRMSRQGRTNRPHFRIGVWDVKSRRDGPPIELLGHYDPLVKDDEKKVTLNGDRMTYWLSQGAAVSDTVKSFLVKRGIKTPDHRLKHAKDRKASQAKLARRRSQTKGDAKPAAAAKSKPAKNA